MSDWPSVESSRSTSRRAPFGCGAFADTATWLGEVMTGSRVFTQSTGAPARLASSISAACTSARGKSPATRSLASKLWPRRNRSEDHTPELQSPCNFVCRLLLEKKKKHHHVCMSKVDRNEAVGIRCIE